MGLFNRDKRNITRQPQRQRRSPTDLQASQERAERKKAWELMQKHLKENPSLERSFILKNMGINVEPPDPAEERKQKVREKLAEESLKMIEEDPDLRREYAEAMLGEVVSMPKFKRSKQEDDMPSYMPGSSIEQAIEDLDSLSTFKQRLSELGMGEEPRSNGGFFGGITMKDILEAVMLLKGNSSPSPKVSSEVRYVVKVEDKLVSVSESEYVKLLNEGKIVPAAEISNQLPEADKEDMVVKEYEDNEPEIDDNDELSHALDIFPVDEMLKEIDLIVYMNNDPQEFVEYLHIQTENGNQTAQFLSGLLSNADYDGVIHIFEHYHDIPSMVEILEKARTDEGKMWIEAVIGAFNSNKEI
jgi:hypothetical protein